MSSHSPDMGPVYGSPLYLCSLANLILSFIEQLLLMNPIYICSPDLFLELQMQTTPAIAHIPLDTE